MTTSEHEAIENGCRGMFILQLLMAGTQIRSTKQEGHCTTKEIFMGLVQLMTQDWLYLG
jgi:hypothetical protein